MATEIGKIFPKAASTARQERLVSEWGLTQFINGIAAWCDGTFWIDENKTKCFIHGYYCELSQSGPAYIEVTNPDNDWFMEVKGPYSGTKDGSGYYSIKDSSPMLNTADNFLNALFMSSKNPIYVIQESAPQGSDSKKIWINSASGRYIPYVNVNGIWTPLGAVYK